MSGNSLAASVPSRGYSSVFWREKKAEDKSADQPAPMRGHADLRSGEVEGALQYDDEDDVHQPLPRERRVTMA